MRPAVIKTTGYLVSCASVGLLGMAAYPGAEKAGLLPALFAGMAMSGIGMVMRWLSYEREKRPKRAEVPPAISTAAPDQTPSLTEMHQRAPR